MFCFMAAEFFHLSFLQPGKESIENSCDENGELQSFTVESLHRSTPLKVNQTGGKVPCLQFVIRIKSPFWSSPNIIITQMFTTHNKLVILLSKFFLFGLSLFFLLIKYIKFTSIFLMMTEKEETTFLLVLYLSPQNWKQ